MLQQSGCFQQGMSTLSACGRDSASLYARPRSSTRLAGPPSAMRPCSGRRMASAGTRVTAAGQSAYGRSRWPMRQACVWGASNSRAAARIQAFAESTLALRSETGNISSHYLHSRMCGASNAGMRALQASA